MFICFSNHWSFVHRNCCFGDGVNREVEHEARKHKGLPKISSQVQSLQPTHTDQEGITQVIRRVAEQEKEPPKLLIVPEGTDEKLWPYDPNLVCPHCGKRFRHGQIREFRYHIDDEHPPSLM